MGRSGQGVEGKGRSAEEIAFAIKLDQGYRRLQEKAGLKRGRVSYRQNRGNPGSQHGPDEPAILPDH